MRRTFGLTLLVGAVVAASLLLVAANDRYVGEPLWLDFDMKDIPEPKERRISYYYSFFGPTFIEQWKQSLDIPRWVRSATGENRRADNINEVDEVPDSSWYNNRHGLNRMSIAELVRGPDTKAPDFGPGTTITKAKTQGVNVGFQVKDAQGENYLIKFDQREFPELQSAAEVISTKILYACGYNVPENYAANIRPLDFKISEKVVVTLPKGKTRPFERSDLEAMLERTARMPDGSHRVLASRFIKGKPKGPFAHIGVRRDDPNDLIPHEHRRELRGLRVIASWINNWDMKEDNSFDAYVEENGRHFLRHYLLDFGSTLGGAGQNPMEYFHGRELVLDAANTMKELFSLGLYVTPDEKRGELISPAVGIFSNAEFDAEGWKPSFPVMPFENMTDEDAFWATRIILSFSEPELRAIIGAGRYTNQSDADYIFRTLWERRKIIVRHWLSKVNPAAEFSVATEGEHAVLRFKDLMVENNLAPAGSAQYIYKVKNNGRTLIEDKSTRETEISLDYPLQVLRARGKEKDPGEAILEIVIENVRPDTDRDPVKIYIYNDPDQNRFRIVGIRRG